MTWVVRTDVDATAFVRSVPSIGKLSDASDRLALLTPLDEGHHERFRKVSNEGENIDTSEVRPRS